jgi:hypothetical protein
VFGMSFSDLPYYNLYGPYNNMEDKSYFLNSMVPVFSVISCGREI